MEQGPMQNTKYVYVNGVLKKEQAPQSAIQYSRPSSIANQ